jgi:hypothetical protein
MVLLSSDDPLAGQATVSLNMLVGRPFIAPDTGSTARYWFDRMFSSVGSPAAERALAFARQTWAGLRDQVPTDEGSRK